MRYDFERQLFASRGYAVLEVNPRGSAGRGVAFEQAGDGRWGAEVQDDFADAVRWAIKDGVAAAGKVCFYGTGYGAYSAMMSAAREPELFQCVIGVGGVYDLPRMGSTTVEMEGSREVLYDSRQPIPEDASLELRAAAERLQMALQVAEGLTTGSVRPGPGFSDALEAAERTVAEATNAVQNALQNELLQTPQAMHDKDDDEAGEAEPARSTRAGRHEEGPIPLLLQRAFGGTVEELEARSPVQHASSIKARVLLLNQFDDKDVPLEQFNAMRAALRREGNRPEAGTIGTENRGHFTPDTRATVYKRMLRFLDEHIGG
jgi:dipeptidyl aminopeptidase/acylaminoacyl peptidase